MITIICIVAIVLFVIAVGWIAVRQERKLIEEEKGQVSGPRYQSLPIDPNNPPRTMRYTPRKGRKRLYCTNPGCFHSLEEGEICLLWPVPQRPGAYDLFCNDCVALGKRKE